MHSTLQSYPEILAYNIAFLKEKIETPEMR